jgi:hypothetical protein
MPFDLRTGSVMMTIGFLRCLNFCKHLLDRTSHTPNGSLTPSRGCGRSLGHPSYNEIRSEMDPTLLNRLRLSSRRGAHRARPHRRLRAIQDDNLHRGLDGDRRPSVVPSRFNVMVRMGSLALASVLPAASRSASGWTRSYVAAVYGVRPPSSVIEKIDYDEFRNLQVATGATSAKPIGETQSRTVYDSLCIRRGDVGRVCDAVMNVRHNSTLQIPMW